MSTGARFLGIDVSTTATKALLVDGEGTPIGSASAEYPLDTPRPLWSEQDPACWWNGAVSAIRAVLRETGTDPAGIRGVGLTGQMHGLVLLDTDGRVLRPAILWNDQRTQTQCDRIHETIGKNRFIERTGNVALTGFTAPKVLWVRENEPEVFARARHLLLPKDAVRYKLTGEFATDAADASGTVLLDLKSRTWSREITDALGIPFEWLPRIVEGPEVTGRICERAAALTGLPAGIPVVGGGGDQAAQAIGVGAVSEGIAALTLGTSGVVFATSPGPLYEPQGRLHAFCHSVPGRWHLMGVMLSAAGSLRWFRDTFAPGTDYATLLKPAADIPVGCEGLLFLPYLTGERTPHPDPLARGAFVGLTLRHRLPHLARAVLEGVAFGLRDSFELMKSAGLARIEQIRVSGGGARSALWRQILADVFACELVTVDTTEGAALGAALLAGVGCGHWPDVEKACSAAVRISGRVSPRAEASAAYQRQYTEYQTLYPALRDTFHRLS
jgi:xylulokinase